MKYIFLLSGDYIELAKEEVISLFDVENYKIIGKLLIVELKNDEKSIIKLSKRLALTKRIYKPLFKCNVNELIDTMKKYDWNTVFKDNFCLRTTHFNINKNSNKKIKIKTNCSEKSLAGYIWRSLSKPKVDLENPATKIELFFIDGKVHCGLLTKELGYDFESRKANLRPFPHPSSLHPKLARALINISGIKENEVLLDPFCGTGGFLIEAGLMDIKVAGYDISENMVKGCKENLKYFKIKKHEIINKNALDIKAKFDYAVTDLPYGLNSNVYLQYNKKSINEKFNKVNLKTDEKFSISRIENFYLEFLKKLRKLLQHKAVIIFPNYVNYKKLLKTAKFKIEKEFSIHVHRSLTRKIVLLRNQ